MSIAKAWQEEAADRNWIPKEDQGNRWSAHLVYRTQKSLRFVQAVALMEGQRPTLEPKGLPGKEEYKERGGLQQNDAPGIGRIR